MSSQALAKYTAAVHCDICADQSPQRSDQHTGTGKGTKEIFPEEVAEEDLCYY